MTQKKKGKVFNFKDQMRIGDIGESDFIKIYEKLKPVKSIKDRKIDFTLNNGKTVELKTDSYSMEKTINFFMEKNTILPDARELLGGPWRSHDHKIDYFVYYYMNDKVFFWFEPKSLCKFLDKYIKSNKIKPISIPNRDGKGNIFRSYGYKIPRADIVDVLLREHKIEIDYKIEEKKKES